MKCAIAILFALSMIVNIPSCEQILPADSVIEISEPPTTDYSIYGTKIVAGYEEYLAAELPLIASLPERDIYLYALKDANDDEPNVLLRVGQETHIYAWEYLTPRFILPQMAVADYDGNGTLELAVSMNFASGTGVSMDRLVFVNLSNQDDRWSEYVYPESAYQEELRRAVTWQYIRQDGEPSSLEVSVGGETLNFRLDEDNVSVGEFEDLVLGGIIVRFEVTGKKITGRFGIAPNYSKMSGPVYFDRDLLADCVYSGGTVWLENIRFSDEVK